MNDADWALSEKYEQSKAEVQRTAAAKLGPNGLAGVDLDAAYNDAWHALYLRLQEEKVENRKGFLVTVTYRRALSERRAARLERATDASELGELGVEADIDARLDAEMQLRHFVQGLRSQLDERELQAVTLCHLLGLSRPEAAKVIGIAPRRMEKLMDRASKRINAVIGAVRPGDLCDDFDSLVRAFAVGLLDEEGERYAIARDHLESCPACRRKVLVLRGLGAVAPPLPAVLAVAGVTGAGAGAAKAGLAGGAKGAASKGVIGKLAGKGAGLSGKAAAVGGAAVAATAAVAVAGVVALSGGGHHAPTAGDGGSPPTPAGAVAGGGGQATPRPAAKQPAHKPREHRREERKAKAPRKQRHHEDEASSTPPPPVAEPEPEVEPTPVAVPEPPVEPTYEAPPEETVEPPPAPPESAPPVESKPTTDAAVEFELR